VLCDAALLSLDVLDSAEACALLASLLGDGQPMAEPDATAELARLCGQLPLALRIAAANLASSPGQSIDDYVTRLRSSDLIGQLAVPDDPQAAVRATFALSYGALDESARRMFRLLGQIPGAELGVPAAAALAGTTVDVAGSLLDVLTRASLLHSGPGGRFGMHDLLRRYAGELAGQEESAAAVRRLFDFYLHTCDAAAALLTPAMFRLPRAPVSSGVRPLVFRDVAAATGWLDSERDNLIASVAYADEHGPVEYTWQLADSLRGYLHSQANLSDWRLVAAAGLHAAERAGSVGAEGAMHHSLGTHAGMYGNNRAAQRHYRRAVECFQRAEQPVGEAGSRNNLGIACQLVGEAKEALTQYRIALELARRQDAPNCVATLLVNLGSASRHLGHLEKSRRHLVEALAIYEQTGAELAKTPAIADLGVVTHELGSVAEAIEYLERALRMARSVEDRHNEANILAALSPIECDAGRFDLAEQRARDALALAREVDDRKVEADARNGLGGVYRRAGALAGALSEHGEAQLVAREIEYPEGEARALIGMADAANQGGDQAAATEHVTQALTLTSRAELAVLHGLALTTLAAIQTAGGQLGEARHTAEHALTEHRETGHRIGEARTLRALGDLLHRVGDHDAAFARGREADELLLGMQLPEARDRQPLLGA
jgi:tetratricopeptide (TPR) repeat protein